MLRFNEGNGTQMRAQVGMIGKKRLVLCAACLFFFIFSGCGKSFDTTTLELGKDGTVILHINEPFDESLYDFDELCAMNEKEVNAYNLAHDTKPVSIKKSEIVDKRAIIDIEYKEDDAYYDMNGTVLFYGDCKSARSAGYNLVGKVRSTSDASELDQKTWKNMTDEKVAIISEPIDVSMPGDIIYMGDGVKLTSRNTVTVDDGGLRYIICK